MLSLLSILNGIAFSGAALKQQYNELINRKSQTNNEVMRSKIGLTFFCKDIINIEEFDSSLLKIYKKSYKDIDIFYTGYITIKKIGNCQNTYIVNPLYLIIGEVDGHTECNSIKFEKNGSKYLVFDSTDESKEN